MSGYKWYGRFAIAAVLGGVLGAFSAAGSATADDAVVGLVSSLRGNAWAEAPGGTARALGCGDVVRDGERILTAPGGRLGLLTGSVYAQLEGDSTLRVARDASGGADLGLQRGRIRVTDTEVGGKTYRLSTPHAVVSGSGHDTAAYVLDEWAGAHSTFCEFATSVDLKRATGSGSLRLAPGGCAVASRAGLAMAAAPQDPIGIVGTETCDERPIVAAAGNRFSPTDVAAGPPPVIRLSPPVPPDFSRLACDSPGSGCAGGLTPPLTPRPGVDRVLPSPPIKLPRGPRVP